MIWTETTNVLSVVNAKSWSWGLSAGPLMLNLPGYKFATVLRQPKCRIPMEQAGIRVDITIPAVTVDRGLVEFFDATLLQNVDSITLVGAEQRKKVVVRMGGLLVDEKNAETRYDDVLREVGAIIATNHALGAIAGRVNPATYIIPNGVDLDRFQPATSHAARDFTAGFAGNVWGVGMTYKGYPYFMQATILLAPEVEIKTNLHAHSQVPHDEMPEKFYHQIDCLVLPSMGEGCSNVVMEALACGVPVLLTKVGYHGETLTDGEDCLFIERDVENIKQTILRLKNDPYLQNRLSENGRAFAEQHHDIKVIAKQYDEVFQNLIRSNQNGEKC